MSPCAFNIERTPMLPNAHLSNEKVVGELFPWYPGGVFISLDLGEGDCVGLAGPSRARRACLIVDSFMRGWRSAAAALMCRYSAAAALVCRLSAAAAVVRPWQG